MVTISLMLTPLSKCGLNFWRKNVSSGDRDRSGLHVLSRSVGIGGNIKVKKRGAEETPGKSGHMTQTLPCFCSLHLILQAVSALTTPLVSPPGKSNLCIFIMIACIDGAPHESFISLLMRLHLWIQLPRVGGGRWMLGEEQPWQAIVTAEHRPRMALKHKQICSGKGIMVDPRHFGHISCINQVNRDSAREKNSATVSYEEPG
ncbi:hypothetical protein FQA47_022328 [Oryzias melastigma]|uniref:Uncharacterized protein n=1 Tax=Oryzias melastigma TaxID=30732 RepID=A0A834BTP0_ORYME|nr:hypothetical protein FQA47_022328 [Oryzias melastigma]